ncbi:MAG: V-type ATP synthase subunit D [Oscillospiraceae bacterium]|jgi:V/A-type H+-transporting ATPase subunit D|nr:V-type ATP synthase subunit D [Oscillospiraceae bacterium]
MPDVTPTKGNLLNIRRSLSLARMGYDLMDRKRNILIHEILALIERAEELQSRIDTTFSAAYASLQSANITLGISSDLAESVALDDTVNIRSRSVMGVEIPIVTCAPRDETDLPYGFMFSDARLDDARERFIQVKHLTGELAELETTIYRLAVAIKKTQKRANALQNIIIPGFAADIAFITDALEEKEREEFVRLKVIKAQGA